MNFVSYDTGRYDINIMNSSYGIIYFYLICSFLAFITILFFIYNGIMKLPVTFNQISNWFKFMIHTKKQIIDEGISNIAI